MYRSKNTTMASGELPVDPYKTLGLDVNPDLTEGEIKKAFRKLALKLREYKFHAHSPLLSACSEYESTQFQCSTLALKKLEHSSALNNTRYLVCPKLTCQRVTRLSNSSAHSTDPDKRSASEREVAEKEFDQLQKAYDILLDPEARAALDALSKARKAREEREGKQDAKRRKMREGA